VEWGLGRRGLACGCLVFWAWVVVVVVVAAAGSGFCSFFGTWREGQRCTWWVCGLLIATAKAGVVFCVLYIVCCILYFVVEGRVHTYSAVYITQ
jgi:hypothetical protein